jgi:arsenate reductase
MGVKRVTPDEAKELLESGSGWVYVDVRTVAEFEGGHVPGAKNVPVFVPDAYGRMCPNSDFVNVIRSNFGKDSKIITGCQMGGRSLRAAEMLASSGIGPVVDMRGGVGGEMDPLGRVTFPGWATRGLPMTVESESEDRYSSLKSRASKPE